MTAVRAVCGLSQNRVTAVYSAHTGQHHVHLCRLEIAATELIRNVRFWPIADIAHCAARVRFGG